MRTPTRTASVTDAATAIGAVNTIVEKGERLDTPSAEVEEQIDDLVSGSAVFFPCTNFLGAIRCEEEGISV